MQCASPAQPQSSATAVTPEQTAILLPTTALPPGAPVPPKSARRLLVLTDAN